MLIHPKAPHNADPLLISTEGLQATIGCGKTTAFALLASGEIESVLQGRRRMAVFASVKAYVERLRDQAKAGVSEDNTKAA